MELNLEIVKKHYRRSERAVKRCERIALAVPTPAINQLRYAGNHVLKAVTASVEAERVEELRKAEFHCQRAWYDAMDSVVLFNLERMRKFADSGYPREAVLHYIPTYDDDIRMAERLYPLFRNVKGVQAMNNAERLALLRSAKSLTGFMAKLKNAAATLDSVFQRMDEEKRRRSERRDLLSTVVSLSASVLGVVLSACGLLTTQCLWAVVIGWIGVVLCLVLSAISSVMLYNTFKTVGNTTSWRASRP